MSEIEDLREDNRNLARHINKIRDAVEHGGKLRKEIRELKEENRGLRKLLGLIEEV